MARGKAAITFFREPSATSCDSHTGLWTTPLLTTSQRLAEQEALDQACWLGYSHQSMQSILRCTASLKYTTVRVWNWAVHCCRAGWMRAAGCCHRTALVCPSNWAEGLPWAQAVWKPSWLQKWIKTALKTVFLRKFWLSWPTVWSQILHRFTHLSFWSEFLHSLSEERTLTHRLVGDSNVNMRL